MTIELIEKALDTYRSAVVARATLQRENDFNPVPPAAIQRLRVVEAAQRDEVLRLVRLAGARRAPAGARA